MSQILDYIAADFQLDVLLRFQDRWESFKETVVHTPRRYAVYTVEEGIPVHKAILNGLTVILFTFDDTRVNIEAIFDTRSDWQGKFPPGTPR